MNTLAFAEGACAIASPTPACPTPAPGPLPPYRGPLRWLAGAPTTDELVAGLALLVGGLMLLYIAWRLLKNYGRACLYETLGPTHWHALAAGICLTIGGELLWHLWREVEQIAGRMGIGILVLLALLVAEAPEPHRSRSGR